MSGRKPAAAGIDEVIDMAAIKVAVVEDEEPCRAQIRSYLQRYEREHGSSVLVREYADGMDLTEDFRGQFDLVFCDIQMKHMNGMKAAEYIRERDEKVIIIFITNLAEYAIMGYDVAATGYLLKPINYTLFERYMERAVSKICRSGSEFLSINENRGVRVFPLAEILYFSCDGHYIDVHMKDETPRIHMSVRELEALLPEKDFARCNSGTIVNLNYVESMNAGLICVQGEALTLSRSQKKPFAEKLSDHLSGV